MPGPLPDDLPTRRRLLYGKGLEAERAATAERFVEAGRLAEALEFLERGRENPLHEKVRRRAAEAGDAFSLQRAAQILEAAATPDEWRDLARRAESRERWYDAVNALERAGDAEKAAALRAARCPDYSPFRPAGK